MHFISAQDSPAVAAVYNGDEMLSIGIVTVEPYAGLTEIPISLQELPAGCTVKLFVLDENIIAPLLEARS